MIRLGIDIGGSSIKGALVDTVRGVFASDRVAIKTPSSLEPDEVLQTVCDVVDRFPTYEGPLGLGFPAVVLDGAPQTPFTAHEAPGWIGYPVTRVLGEWLGRAVTMVNDADAAGLAEMRFGNGRGEKGVVLVLTLGTGIGSALFIDGQLVPNTELGLLYLCGRDEVAEKQAAALIRDKEGLSWEAYAARLDEYLAHVYELFSPRLIILGGGISRDHQQFVPHLTVKNRVVPAALRNRAGVIGAATMALASEQ